MTQGVRIQVAFMVRASMALRVMAQSTRQGMMQNTRPKMVRTMRSPISTPRLTERRGGRRKWRKMDSFRIGDDDISETDEYTWTVDDVPSADENSVSRTCVVERNSPCEPGDFVCMRPC